MAKKTARKRHLRTATNMAVSFPPITSHYAMAGNLSYTSSQECYNLSYDEFTDIVCYLFQCTKKELDEIIKADDTPVWMVNVCIVCCWAVYSKIVDFFVKVVNF